MSVNEALHLITLPAGSDLSAKQFYFVKLSAGKLALASTGEAAIGVLQDKPNADGQPGLVAIGGRTQVIAGGSISVDAAIKSDSAGKAATASAATVDTSNTGGAADAVVASNVMGYALEAASSGDIFAMLLTPRGAVPTTAA
jgi:hypothetical protein